MLETRLKIRPPLILIEAPLEEGYKSQQIGWGTRYDGNYKAFKTPFCPETLKMIHRLFDKPVVIEGQEFIDDMKVRLQDNWDGRQAMMKSTFPEDKREYKLEPRKHQYTGMYYLEQFMGGALFADCGTGKTAMTLWDIQHKYDQELIKPSSVLIVGKLMTLFSGWASDALKFTNLQGEVLWEPAKGKAVREGSEVVADHGPKPKGKSKTRGKTEYFFHDGRPAIIDSRKDINPKIHVKKRREWKEVNGVKYGTERLVTFFTRNLRNESIVKKIKESRAGIHVINHEGLLIFEKELAKREYDYIVIDESTAIKAPSAKINRALNNICKNTKYRRILSGTPSPQGPMDLWSQFYFLDNGLTLGPSYREFLEQHFDMVRLGSVENGTYAGRKPCISPKHKRDTEGWIQSRLENRVFRCKLRDCVDLPPLTESTLDVYLAYDQQRHYEEMRDAFCTTVNGERIEVTVDLAKIAKLRQITGGFVINQDGKALKAASTNPKLEALQSAISEIDEDEKIIIFAVHRAEIEMLRRVFGKKAVALYGGVGDKERLNAQDRFINDPKVKYIICQPKSAAYGVNGLTVARYLFFYSIDYQADTDYQAKKRIERMGQERAMFVYYLIAVNTIDGVIYRAVRQKDRVQQRTINLQNQIEMQIVQELSGISKEEGKD